MRRVTHFGVQPGEMTQELDPVTPELDILMVEDHYPDARWVELLLDDVQLPHRITHFDNAFDALNFLNQRTPDLALLDVNLPKMDGIELLHQIRNDGDRLRKMPVCMLTSSDAERDHIIRRYSLDTRCYIVKPLSYQSLRDALSTYESLRGFVEVLKYPE
jgi:chemotaxis family two-component system response regulator Rcp1